MIGRRSHSLLIAMLAVGAAVSLFPAVWMIYTSFCPAEELSRIPPVLIHRRRRDTA